MELISVVTTKYLGGRGAMSLKARRLTFSPLVINTSLFQEAEWLYRMPSLRISNYFGGRGGKNVNRSEMK